MVQSTASAAAAVAVAVAVAVAAPFSVGARRHYYVGNLHLNMKETLLRQVLTVTNQPGMQDVRTNAYDFEDDEDGGLVLNACFRALLIQKLDCSGSTPSIVGLLGNPIVHSPGLVLPTAPILGAAPSFSPLVSPLVHDFVSGLAGLPGADLTVPLLLLLLLISLVFLACVYC